MHEQGLARNAFRTCMVYVLRETIDVHVSRCAADRDKASALCFSRRPLKTDPWKLAQVPALNFYTLMAVSGTELLHFNGRFDCFELLCVKTTADVGQVKLKDDFDGYIWISAQCTQYRDADNALIMTLIQTHKRFKRIIFIRTKTQSANFLGNPFYHATERHLTDKRWKTMKN